MVPQISHVMLLLVVTLAVAFFLLGAMLWHHWQKYSPNQIHGYALQLFYWGAGGTLLVIMTVIYFTLPA